MAMVVAGLTGFQPGCRFVAPYHWVAATRRVILIDVAVREK